MKLTSEYRKEIIEIIHSSDSAQLFAIEDLELLLNKFILVPHPDTLILIERAADIISSNPEITTIADIGTGSGFIAIQLAKSFPKLQFFATDISEEALDIARQNALRNNIKNIEFRVNTDHHWLSELNAQTIDFIVSNPPFVGKAEYDSAEFKNSFPEVALEPIQAIETEDLDGTEPYEQMMKNSLLQNTKHFLFQCNSLHINQLAFMASTIFKNPEVTLHKDTTHKDRFLEIYIK